MGPEVGSGGQAEHTVDLLNRARIGDQRAWECLYERYEAELRRRVGARFGSELRTNEESIDVLQSIWREAIGSLEHFEYRDEGSFLAWLATILRHKIAHRTARLHTVKRGGAATPESVPRQESSRAASSEPGPATRAERDEDHELLLQTIQQLAADQRDLVQWALIEERPHREIAARLGIGEDAARMRVARAEARLTALHRRRHGGDGERSSSGDRAEE